MTERIEQTLETAQRRFSELKRKLVRVEHEYEQCSAQIDELMSSHSWRITAPMRNLRIRWLRRHASISLGTI